MKVLALALTMVISSAVSAAMPVTEAINNILPAGSYNGRNCLVVVETKKDLLVVTVKSNSGSDSFGLLNSSKGVVINEVTGEISASQSLNFPSYLRGGTKFLNIRSNEEEVAVSISNILLDHKGNDASTYAECSVTL